MELKNNGRHGYLFLYTVVMHFKGLVWDNWDYIFKVKLHDLQ